MRNRLTIITLVIVLGAVIGSIEIQRRTKAKLAQGDLLLRQQEDQLAGLKAKSSRLSSSYESANPKGTEALSIDRMTELAELRAKIEALRQKTNELGKAREQLAEWRRLEGVRFYSVGDSNLVDLSRGIKVSFAGGPREPGKLNDARALTAALRKYAQEHAGAFPPTMDVLQPYLPGPLATNSRPWENAPLSGTNEFEIVFQGLQNDLTNIPPRRVALIRERQPWQDAEGKWMRVYGWSDGAAELVQSDDGFRSWDSQHIIPPRNAQND
jgi:hypothetical protein